MKIVKAEMKYKSSWSKDHGIKRILIKGVKRAKEYLDAYNMLKSQMHTNQMKRMLTEIKHSKSKAIGRWTAAEIYRQYLSLRAQLYEIQLFKQMYEEYTVNKTFGFSVDSNDLAQDLANDFKEMDAWSKSTHGFAYTSGYCTQYKSWTKNDLTWPNWAIQQCISRYGKEHSTRNQVCCGMWRYDPSYYSGSYYWDKNKKLSQKCDYSWDSGTGCYSNYTKGSFTKGNTSWGSWVGSKYAPSGYLMCGFRPNFERSLGGGDDTALDGLEIKWCKASYWYSQSSTYLYRSGTLFGTWRGWQMCPSGSYATSMRVRGERSIDGDDTAMNGLHIYCRSLNWSYRGSTKFDGIWGSWTSWTPETRGYFIYRADLRVEKCSDCDDTAANQFSVSTKAVHEKGYWKSRTFNMNEFK